MSDIPAMIGDELLPVSSLRHHPLSAKIYGTEPLDDLVESIRANGVLTPLTINADRVVISGHRRLAAAKLAGFDKVPVVYLESPDDLTDEMAVIEANRTREKTNEQKAREYAERLRIEKELAKKRQKAAGGDKKSKAAKKSVVANLPQPIPEQEPEPAPKARDLAAAPVGWKARTAEKALAVVQYADETGDTAVLETMNARSVDSAFAQVKRARGETPAPPPFDAQYSNVWRFAGLTDGFGQPHPGNIPGDIVRNLLWLYTQPDDLVVDPFAGGGVTLDVVTWWNAQPGLWPLRQASYDLTPVRAGIRQHDVTTGLPDEAQDAGLVFLDPPYWRQKRGEYSDKETDLANMSLDDFESALDEVLSDAFEHTRTGGHVALIIGPTTGEAGEYVDHGASMKPFGGAWSKWTATLVNRVIVPYTTQQFSAADVAQAREQKRLLKGYRDLLIWRKDVDADAKAETEDAEDWNWGDDDKESEE